MQSKLSKTIIGAIIAVALAAAVSYGLINQQTADQLQTKANQTLSNDQAAPTTNPQQPVPAPTPQTPTPAPRP
jgi:cell division septation protein DedD